MSWEALKFSRNRSCCYGVHMQEKAAKLHKQLHGSTFHLKLAQEAMKKVRQVEAEAEAAKAAAEAEALKAGTDQLMLLLLLL